MEDEYFEDFNAFYTHQFVRDDDPTLLSVDTNNLELYQMSYCPVLPGTVTGTIYCGEEKHLFAADLEGIPEWKFAKTIKTFPCYFKVDHALGMVYVGWNEIPDIDHGITVSYEYEMGR
jgi:hypothetical protein